MKDYGPHSLEYAASLDSLDMHTEIFCPAGDAYVELIHCPVSFYELGVLSRV